MRGGASGVANGLSLAGNRKGYRWRTCGPASSPTDLIRSGLRRLCSAVALIAPLAEGHA